MKTVILGLLILLFIYVGICLFYYIFQERFIFVPWGKTRGKAPVLLASEYTEYFLNGTEKGVIHALHIKTTNPRGIILYFHGNTGSMHRWATIAEELTSFGFDVFLPDYRGYGRSKGRRSEEILFKDAVLCYEKVKEMYPENKICVYGRSLGTGMASWLAVHSQPAGIVLETPFNNLIEVAKHHLMIVPVKYLMRYTFKNEVYLKKSTSPILIVHGTKDKIVKYKLALRLYKSIKSYVDVEMLTVPGGGHGNLNQFPVFRETLERFFDKYFST